EAATLHVGGLILDLDTTELGGIGRVVELDRHDVVVARHRPVGAVPALGAIVDGRLAPQARKEGSPRVLRGDGGVADIERAKWLQESLGLGKGRGGHAFLPGLARVVALGWPAAMVAQLKRRESSRGAILMARACCRRRFSPS